jgi:hypothetical protein
MKAVKVIIGVVLVGVGAWLVFAAFWNVLGTPSSPDLYFALRFGIGLVCLSSGFSMIGREGFLNCKRAITGAKAGALPECPEGSW